jgi:hypothetical protein
MRYVSVLFTVLLLAAFLVYSSPYGEAATSTIVVPDDYSTIQAAVDAASAGDTVFVKAGIYHENVVVNKSIFINGEDANTTIIDGSATGGTLVSITASNVTVSNFTIKSHSDSSDRGVVLSGSNFSNINGNVITGLWYWGAVVLDLNSCNNLLFGNYIAKAQGCGIFLNNTSRANRIINNTVYLCFCAIFSDGYSNESVILHNSFIRNLEQVYLSSSPNTLDDGYPSGGNLWAGYVGTDLYNGPNQDILGSDGICDAPYAISGGVDRYPFFVSGQDATVRFYIEPSSLTVRKGQTFNVTIKLDNMPEYPGFVGIEFAITWNSSILNCTGISDILFHTVTPGDEQDNIWQIVSRVNSGYVWYAYLWHSLPDAFFGGYAPIWGDHSVATITLTAVGEGTCVLDPVLVKVGSEFGSFDPEERSYLIYVGGQPGKSSLLNHTITGCTVEVKSRNLGDCNGDNRVDILDTIVFSNSFGAKLGDLKYDDAADQNLDGIVDVYDVILVAANFGNVYE